MNEDIERRNAGPDPDQKSVAAAKAAPKKGRGKKVAHNLVVASAIAIMSVYSAGYAVTQSAASQLATQTQPTSLVQSSPAGAPTAAASGTPRTTATNASSTSSSSSTTAATSTYKDGTYTGTGTSRHGGIQATVVIQNGKIVSANITGSSTRYPTSRISSLPAKVVSGQSTRVNYVSGATDSSAAYLTAVSNALAQAA